MKSFKQYIEYLVENRLEFLKNRYKDLNSKWDTYRKATRPNDIVDYWAKVDPTPNHKYVDWILRQYSKHDFRQEDDVRVHNALENFERYKIHLAQKDINHYHHLSDLEDVIDTVKGTKSKREEIKATKYEGADKIFDKGGVTVYHIKTEAAAKFYGAGTKWCTAADKNHCQFNYYNNQGPLYVVFCKDPEGRPAKYQFHFESNQFMDEKDRSIDLAELVKKNPELQEVPAWQGKKAALTKNFNMYFDKLLLSNPKDIIKDSRITSEHISKMSNDPNPYVRWQAIRHPNATSEHITKVLNDLDPRVRIMTIKHPKATLEHISKALNDPDPDVRSVTIRKSNATSEHITKVLNDPNPNVRWQAIRHPKATPEHITKALNDSDSGVRLAAIKHPKATPEHISKALNDSDPEVRWEAIRHPNATLENISKALNDSNSDVRNVAKKKIMQKEIK